jgi:hypothetical protein
LKPLTLALDRSIGSFGVSLAPETEAHYLPYIFSEEEIRALLWAAALYRGRNFWPTMLRLLILVTLLHWPSLWRSPSTVMLRRRPSQQRLAVSRPIAKDLRPQRSRGRLQLQERRGFAFSDYPQP